MLNNDLRMSGKAGEHDRRDGHTPGNRFLGRVVACSGSRATIAAVAEQGGTDLTELWSVGRLISISVGRNRVVALVYQMNTGSHAWGEGEDNIFKIETELLGEVRVDEDGREEFSTGISRYPYLGAIAHRIRSADLMRIYDAGEGTTAVIGKLTQDESIDAAIHIPSMLSKHFAVVGSTGVGKSTAVSLLLHKAIAADPKLRVLILDPHNEFAAAFPQHAVTIDTDTLDLPFWLMRLEEFAEVVFRGRPPVPEELDMLRDILPEAKRAFRGSDNSLVRRTTEKSSITADTPVPYRMADLLALIDERIGRLEGRSEKPFLRSLKMRLIAAINDPRYHFMFSNNTISDTITETIAQIFRIPGENRPICTFQLAGIPSEVVNSVASVLCRMAFEVALWSDGAIHMLVVCEEAHRYIPSDPSLGFVPTRQAIARIAKEGRKYGVSLGIITQRPGELDQTILSQCSTLFAMRLANDRDQEIIRSAIPNSSISTTSFISSIGNGEAIAFGEAISVPMRMRFSRVDEKLLPKASSANSKQSEEDPDTVDLRKIVTRMRAVTVGPDISNFQQNYAASVAGFDEADAADEDLDAKPYAPPTSSVAPLESYRRELLPQTPRLDPATSPAIDPRLDALRREMRRDEPVFPRPTPPADQPAVSRREPGTSLRESILKKPLSSLYNKD
ncbi:ATP-binding protein [Rhizobium leguminosarum]|uniref:ATP-binding protein n=1 Tax=Rhizobium leguminosarum TaxID=384 RepID=A0AAJ1ADC5_RHILE|nr:ATP-binding protein [Rhizobium leguminosarum]MBY5536942.1 ATP-binding protein [Rhizobium leguminosarum]MBY5581534.1 ATP-binding protein [Rhizobium leguminosarum]MBY5593655.1 ATP-binding protein [Rhizobium leguminosarum]MBY5613208.1 ATP-binding protein [Rhizobium leguminosarum]MBY5632014.1 ATP-binding protein [Rhizobium leguminosarum]